MAKIYRCVETPNGEWDFDLCAELCREAGLEDEWNAADGETFESVIYKAADILGVTVFMDDGKEDAK